MDSHDIIRQAVKKVGVKDLATTLGVSSSLIYKWADKNCDPTGGHEESAGAHRPAL